MNQNLKQKLYKQIKYAVYFGDFRRYIYINQYNYRVTIKNLLKSKNDQ